MTEPTTPLPESPYCRVRARVASIWADGPDAGTSPDWRPAVGEKVTLTPSISSQLLVYDAAGPNPIIVTVERVECVVDEDGWLAKSDGRPVFIAPTDDPLMSATGWTWTASIKGKSITFSAPAGGVVDLAMFIAAPATNEVKLWVERFYESVADLQATIDSVGDEATQAAADAQAEADRATAAADTVQEISGLTGEDDAVALLASDRTSGTGAAIRALVPIVNVRDFGAVGDLSTDDTIAIRTALAATPRGGALVFPPGSYRVSGVGDAPVMTITKPVNLVGGGASVLVVDQATPAHIDIIYIKPDAALSTSKGYRVEGLSITGEASTRPARHAIHIDLTEPGSSLSDSAIARNLLWPLGGASIKLTNPTNTDGFFTSRISENLIYSGLMLERCGDSVTIEKNTIPGWGAVDITMVDGSNTLAFVSNNITCRGGFRIGSGHNIKILYNNFEVGAADSTGSNGALLDIDGSDTATSWGLLAVEVLGNNFAFRATSPGGITAIRVGKARGTIIEGNHISRKDSPNLVVDSLAQETVIGPNLMSYTDPAGLVVDEGVRTVRTNFMRSGRTGREHWLFSGEAMRTRGTRQVSRFDRTEILPDHPTNGTVAEHQFFPENGSTIKHQMRTQRLTSEGAVDGSPTLVYSIHDGYLAFWNGRFAIRDSGGHIWRLMVDSAGTISTEQIT